MKNNKSYKMKILSFFIIAATTLAVFGNSGADGIITMTTNSHCIKFEFTGSGYAIVDWGDGSKKDTVLLKAVELEWAKDKGWAQISRLDFDTIPRTITITGENITGLICAARYIVIGGRFGGKCNQFTALDVSQNPALTYLDCDYTGLTELDVSKNTALKRLHCSYNQLTELDVSKNIALLLLGCGNNQLTALDVSKNVALTILHCRNNQLAVLDLSRNTALKSLNCSNNPLTKLNVSQSTVLEQEQYSLLR